MNNEMFHKSYLLLKKYSEVDAAYLYGSILFRKDFEDIDIALFLSQKTTGKWELIKLEIASALEKIWKKECDVHILQEMPLHLQYRIICDGKLIIAQNKIAQVRFEAKILSEFLDFKPTYDWLNNKILKRFSKKLLPITP